MVFVIGSVSDRVNAFINATTLGRLIGGLAQIAQSRTTESTWCVRPRIKAQSSATLCS